MANSMQIGILLVFLSCVIYEVSAISCYKCTSYRDRWCSDDFDKSIAPAPTDCNVWAQQQKIEETPDACFKIVQKVHRIIRGKWYKPVVLSNITTRGCGFKSSGSGCLDLTGAQSFGASCHCITNRCNAAGSVHMTFTFILSLLAASFAVFKFLSA